jgi:phosphatidylglycerophosphatase A
MLKKLLITFFGTGYLPIAPGTWGSLLAVILFSVVAPFTDNTPLLRGILIVAIVLATIAGVVLGRWAVEFFQKKDPSQYVLDEAAGMWLSVLLIPFHDGASLFMVCLVQFILFRIFDIIKPTPARQAEGLPLGWGIMADDLVAGAYANLCGQILFRLILST